VREVNRCLRRVECRLLVIVNATWCLFGLSEVSGAVILANPWMNLPIKVPEPEKGLYIFDTLEWAASTAESLAGIHLDLILADDHAEISMEGFSKKHFFRFQKLDPFLVVQTSDQNAVFF